MRRLLGVAIRYPISIDLDINNNNRVDFCDSFAIDIVIYKIGVILYRGEAKIYLILAVRLALLFT